MNSVSPYGDVQKCNIVVSESEIQSHSYIHF